MGRFRADLVPPICAAACPAPPRLSRTHLQPIQRTRAPARCAHLARGPESPTCPPRPASGALARLHEAKAVGRAQCRGLVTWPPHRSAPPNRVRDTCGSLLGPGGYCGQPPALHGRVCAAPALVFVTKCAPIPTRAPHLSVAANGATSRLTGRSWYRRKALGEQVPMRTTPRPTAPFPPAQQRFYHPLSTFIQCQPFMTGFF